MVTKKVLKDKIEYRNEKGLLHREDGPAYEHETGYKSWFINGKRHREDGPTCEYPDGSFSFYLNDKRYSEQEWQDEVIKIKLERLKNYGN
jgi:hypothetical protein